MGDINCKFCGSSHVVRNGKSLSSDGRIIQKAICRDCGKHPQYDTNAPVYSLDHVNKLPNVLIFDLETTPNYGAFWNVWKQNIADVQIKRPSHLLSWAAKWLFSGDIMTDILTPDEAISANDERITKSLWKLFDDADIIIAHNLKKFDRKVANSCFLKHKLIPPKSYQMVDTLEELRKHFKENHNRLDSIGRRHLDSKKLDTDFTLWDKCVEGNKPSLDRMIEYNIQDVYLLESVYIMLRPWIKSHPNLSIYAESKESCCGKCLSKDIKLTGGEYITPAGAWAEYRCTNCGNILRGRTNLMKDAYKDNLLLHTSR